MIGFVSSRSRDIATRLSARSRFPSKCSSSCRWTSCSSGSSKPFRRNSSVAARVMALATLTRHQPIEELSALSLSFVVGFCRSPSALNDARRPSRRFGSGQHLCRFLDQRGFGRALRRGRCSNRSRRLSLQVRRIRAPRRDAHRFRSFCAFRGSGLSPSPARTRSLPLSIHGRSHTTRRVVRFGRRPDHSVGGVVARLGRRPPWLLTAASSHFCRSGRNLPAA